MNQQTIKKNMSQENEIPIEHLQMSISSSFSTFNSEENTAFLNL
jgi:hypothetical protein